MLCGRRALLTRRSGRGGAHSPVPCPRVTASPCTPRAARYIPAPRQRIRRRRWGGRASLCTTAVTANGCFQSQRTRSDTVPTLEDLAIPVRERLCGCPRTVPAGNRRAQARALWTATLITSVAVLKTVVLGRRGSLVSHAGQGGHPSEFSVSGASCECRRGVLSTCFSPMGKQTLQSHGLWSQACNTESLRSSRVARLVPLPRGQGPARLDLWCQKRFRTVLTRRRLCAPAFHSGKRLFPGLSPRASLRVSEWCPRLPLLSL